MNTKTTESSRTQKTKAASAVAREKALSLEGNLHDCYFYLFVNDPGALEDAEAEGFKATLDTLAEVSVFFKKITISLQDRKAKPNAFEPMMGGFRRSLDNIGVTPAMLEMVRGVAYSNYLLYLKGQPINEAVFPEGEYVEQSSAQAVCEA